MNSTIGRFAAVVATISLCWMACPARAEDLTLTFDTLGEPNPQVVCVLASFISAKGATPWDPKATLGQWTKPLGPLEPSSDRVVSSVDHAADAYCDQADTGSPADGLARAVVIEIEHANISAITVAANTVRVAFTGPKNSTAAATVKVLGGDYHSATEVPVRAFDTSQRLHVELTPRRSRRVFNRPYIKQCEKGIRFKLDETARGLGPAFEPTERDVVPAFVEIDNAARPGGAFGFWMCDQEVRFVSEWSGKVPPQSLPFWVKHFRLFWSRSCMVTAEGCPEVYVLGQAGHCEEVKAPSTLDACQYTCTAEGRSQFPVDVRFRESFGRPPANAQAPQHSGGATAQTPALQERWNIFGSWTENVQYPRQELHGYLSPDQRRLRLDWSDAPQGEHDIAYVEMRAADGRLLRVEPGQPSIAMSDLACGDLVAYRFVGVRRLYSESQQGVDRGTLHLIEPELKLGGMFSLGLAFGGGFRFLGGPQAIQWRPYLEGQATLVMRSPDWIRFHLDLRVSGVISAQPFCSAFRGGSASNTDCRSDQWSTPLFWRIPVDAGFTYYFSQFPFSAGAGVAASREVNSRDSSRVASGPLLTARASIGYEFVRGFSLEFQARYFYGERYLRTRIDELGTIAPRSTHPDSTPHSLFMGIYLRYNDLVSTTAL